MPSAVSTLNKFSQNLHFGTDQRFKTDAKFNAQPGPGNYNDSNKWNKRTYNLKFLNFQAHSAATTKASSNHNRSFSMHNTIDANGGPVNFANNTTANQFNTI